MEDFPIVTTRSGDDGKTKLYGGGRISKHDPILECLGSLDELNAWLGHVRLQLGTEEAWLLRRIEEVQRSLFSIGTLLATPDVRDWCERCPIPDLEGLEKDEKLLLEKANPPPGFVIPGQEPRAAIADIARTVCRRAERRLVAVYPRAVPPAMARALAFLNRLSDFLYLLARYLEQGATKMK